MRPFEEGIYLKYSKIEKVKKILEISHPIIRETLKLQKIKIPQIPIKTEPIKIEIATEPIGIKDEK